MSDMFGILCMTHQPTPLRLQTAVDARVVRKCRAARPTKLGSNLGHIMVDVKQMVDCLFMS
jgi:hypothetical protein